MMGGVADWARPVADRRAMVAARNNADWCDAVCRTHGLATTFYLDAWVSSTRAPAGYPDAVTLAGSVAVGNLLNRVNSFAGCSVKDSFATLDLSESRFEVLFEAEWIYRRPAAPADRTQLRWEAVRTVAGLSEWREAHGGGDVLRPDLLDDPAVRILAATDPAGKLAAGAIGNRSDNVVGLSNMFTVSVDREEAWAGAVAAFADSFPDLPVVGYEHGRDLAAARGAGFTSVGGLRVWVKR
jgi:hypothetical protein